MTGFLRAVNQLTGAAVQRIFNQDVLAQANRAIELVVIEGCNRIGEHGVETKVATLKLHLALVLQSFEGRPSSVVALCSHGQVAVSFGLLKQTIDFVFHAAPIKA